MCCWQYTEDQKPGLSGSRQRTSAKRQTKLSGKARLEAVGEPGMAAARARGAHGCGQCTTGPDEDDQLLGPSDRCVEQVTAQHHPRAGGERDDYRRVLAALRTVNGSGIGVRELIELVEAVIDALVLVGQHGELPILQGHPGDHTDGAVEDPSSALV